MAAFQHHWLQTPPEAFRHDDGLSNPNAMFAIMQALNARDVGGSGWKFAGMTPDGKVIVLVRELPPPGALTAEQVMAEADVLGSAKSKKK